MASKSLTFDIFGRDRTASKAIQGVGSSAAGLTRTFAAVGGAIAAAFAVTRIVNFARTTVTEFAEAEASQQKLSDAFARFPALAGANQNALINLNKELQKKTRFDDDALAVGEATLAQYGLTEAQLTQLTPLLADYAAKTGKDLPDAALDLGKALLGQGRALKAIGVNFKDTGSVAGNFESLIASLQLQVGGFAEGEAKNLAVQMIILKNAFGEAKESVGSIFAPAIGLLAGLINDKLLPVLATLVDKYGPQIEDFFTAGAENIGGLFDRLNKALSDGTIRDNIPIIATSFAALGTVLMQQGVIEALGKLATQVLPPLVDLLVALTPLIPPLADVLTSVLVPALKLVTTLFSGYSALFSGNLDQQRQWVSGVMSISGPLGDFYRGWAGGIVGIFNAVVDAMNALGQGWKGLVGIFGIKINVPVLPHVSLAGVLGTGSFKPSGSSGTTKVAKGGRYASGGFFQAKPGGYLGVIGEGASDEVALPLTGAILGRIGAGIAASGGAGGGGGGTQVVIQMAPGSIIANQRDAVKWMTDAFNQVNKRGGVPRGAFS